MLHFWNKKSLAVFLAPFSWIYGLVIFLRNRLYKWRIYSIHKMNAKVISIGNITVGGTGKTPFVAFCAKLLQKSGYRVAVLTRGYGRKTRDPIIVINDGHAGINPKETGDEPALLADQLKCIPIAVGKNRIESGQSLHQSYGSEVLILDDGFQHRKLYRDLNIVLIDASNPLGNGYLLPAGPLREPLKNIRRADMIVLTRTDSCKNCDSIIQSIQNFTTVPIFTSKHRPTKWITFPGQVSKNLDILKGKNVLAFSGIGNPDSFIKTLQDVGVSIADFVPFRDHYWYTPKDWDNLLIRAWQKNADAIVTTEKDAVRLTLGTEWGMPTYYLKIEIQLIGGKDKFKKKLLSLFK